MTRNKNVYHGRQNYSNRSVNAIDLSRLIFFHPFQTAHQQVLGLYISFIEKLKASLKDRWLDYYLVNQSWLKKIPGWVQSSDGGKRPPCLLILGSTSLLEPSLKELLLPFCELSPEPTKLVDLLGLNFDPRIELEKRAVEAAKTHEAEIIPLLTDTDTDYLNKIREETIK